MEANSEVIVHVTCSSVREISLSLSLCGMWNELWLQTESVYRSLSQPGTALHNNKWDLTIWERNNASVNDFISVFACKRC